MKGNFFLRTDDTYIVFFLADIYSTSALLEDAHVKYEAAAPVGETEAHKAENEVLFPHIYGALNVTSVTKEYAVKRDCDDGTFLEVEGLWSVESKSE